LCYNISADCIAALGNFERRKSLWNFEEKKSMKKKVMDLKEQGKSVGEISEVLGISKAHTRDYLEEIPIRLLAQNKHVKKLLVDKLDQGISPQKLQEITNIPQKTLKKWKTGDMSDEDEIQSDGEFSREDIRESLCEALLGNKPTIKCSEEKMEQWLGLIGISS